VIKPAVNLSRAKRFAKSRTCMIGKSQIVLRGLLKRPSQLTESGDLVVVIRGFFKLPQEALAAEIGAENQKPQPNCRTQDKNREDHTKSNEPFECFAKFR
jgi:hypothetical protein